MKAPFYNVYLDSDEEITDMIESLTFEDCIKEDDYVGFTIKSPHIWKFDEDNKYTLTGAYIRFQFGYMGLESSGFRKARITDNTPKYAETISLTIKALDKGTVMKKDSSAVVWNNKTTKEIIEEIASYYDMTAVCEYEGTRWKSIPQGLLSDWEFLQKLANKETDGDYIIFCRDNTIVFTKIGVDKKSVRTFTYGDGSGTVISFEPKQQESTAKKEGVKTTMVGFDHLNKKSVVSTSKNGEASKSTGEFVNVFDEYSHSQGTTKTKAKITQDDKIKDDGIMGKIKGLGKILPVPSMPESEVQNASKSMNKKKALGNLTAVLKVMGDPTLRSNEIITMDGVFKKHKGNWLIIKATHSISGSGYITTLDLEKNGTKQGVKKYDSKTQVNKSVGSANGEPKKKSMVVMDAYLKPAKR